MLVSTVRGEMKGVYCVSLTSCHAFTQIWKVSYAETMLLFEGWMHLAQVTLKRSMS